MSSDDDALLERPLPGRACKKNARQILVDIDFDGQDDPVADAGAFIALGSIAFYDAGDDKQPCEMHELLYKLRAGISSKDRSIFGLRMFSRRWNGKRQVRWPFSAAKLACLQTCLQPRAGLLDEAVGTRFSVMR